MSFAKHLKCFINEYKRFKQFWQNMFLFLIYIDSCVYVQVNLKQIYQLIKLNLIFFVLILLVLFSILFIIIFKFKL